MHIIAEHFGSATQPSQENTTKPVGLHFRLPGHSHSDMAILPIERVRHQDRFILEAREKFWINKYQVVTNGLNIQ